MNSFEVKESERINYKLFDEFSDDEDFIDAIRHYICTKDIYEPYYNFEKRSQELFDIYQETKESYE
jgi:hypothetical protein